MAEPDPVDEVRGAAPDQQPERDRQHRVAGSGTCEEDEHPADRERGQRRHEPGCVREQAEGDARVLDVVDRERAEDVHLIVQRELTRDDVLRHLVGQDGRSNDEAQADPLGPARGE